MGGCHKIGMYYENGEWKEPIYEIENNNEIIE